MPVPESRMCTMKELRSAPFQDWLDIMLGPPEGWAARLGWWLPEGGSRRQLAAGAVRNVRRLAAGGIGRRGIPRHRPHRKAWEFAVIAQCLADDGQLQPGKRGLGFAVGREPLPALFAARGCDVVATDLPVGKGVDSSWEDSGQHADSIEALQQPHICTAEQLRRQVSFRGVDMRAIPGELRDFDFVWSSCAFEHLGSLEDGMHFVRRAMHCLRPGGLAVHTTEFNVASNTDTLTEGGSVIYRRRDLEALADELRADGHEIRFDWTSGDEFEDHFVDRPPYRQAVHLRLELGGYVATSFLVAVRRAGG